MSKGICWTAPVLARLRYLWSEGYSTNEIGRRMGISKNAVVGKAHRLNLEARPSPIAVKRPAGPRGPRIKRVADGAATLPPLPVLAVTAPDIAACEPVPPPPPPESLSPPVPVTDPRPESPPILLAPAPEQAPPAPPAIVVPEITHKFVPVTPAPLIPPPLVVARPLREPEPCSWVLAPASRRGALPKMCDAPCLDGKPFCPAHAAICYVRAAARREDAA